MTCNVSPNVYTGDHKQVALAKKVRSESKSLSEGYRSERKEVMKLLTKAHETQLRKNYEANLKGEGGIDFQPVVKLFTANAGATWLLSELSPDGMLFGLCDLGHGFPELGYVSLADFEKLPSNLLLERDQWFTATKTLSEYAEEARNNQRIVA